MLATQPKNWVLLHTLTRAVPMLSYSLQPPSPQSSPRLRILAYAPKRSVTISTLSGTNASVASISSPPNLPNMTASLLFLP